eukprot:1126223-Rhodomonas_salina.3
MQENLHLTLVKKSKMPGRENWRMTDLGSMGSREERRVALRAVQLGHVRRVQVRCKQHSLERVLLLSECQSAENSEGFGFETLVVSVVYPA